MAKLIDTTVYGDLVSTQTISAGTVLYVPNGTGINEFSIDGTFAGNSDDALPTEKAVKTYSDNISAASWEKDNRLQENIDSEVSDLNNTINTLSANKIIEGDSGVVVNDEGTGSITISADGKTVAGWDANIISMKNSMNVGPVTGNAIIELGAFATGNRYAYMDFIGDDTYSDYGLRIIRGNSGKNSTSSITQRGAGDLQFYTVEAANILWYTNNAFSMIVTSAGDVGIGTDAPDYKLHIKDDSPILEVEATSNSRSIRINPSAGSLDSVNSALHLNRSSAQALAVGFSSDSRIRVGQAAWETPALLYIGNSLQDVVPLIIEVTGNNTADVMTIRTSAGGELFTIDSDGKVGIGTNNPGRALDVIGEGIGITGFFNPQSSAGMVLAHQNAWNRGELHYYDESTWTTVMQFADGEDIDLGFGNVEGYIGVNHISSNYFKGSSGTTISEFSIDGTLAGNSDDAVPTEKATKTYVDNISMANLGSGEGVYYQESGQEFQLKSLVAGNNIALPSDSDTITVSAAHLRGEGGIVSIANGVSTATVTFDTSAADTFYAVSISLSNEIDANPSMYGMTVTEKTTEGFTVNFSGVMDSANYVLDWAVNQKNVPTNTQYNTMPAGAVVSWVTSAAPDGWLECDGSAVSRTSYDTLFDVIGEQFGNGDGSTTFNLPDLRGEFLRGWDHGAGNDPDAADRTARGDGVRADHVGSVQADELESHAHSYEHSTVDAKDASYNDNVAFASINNAEAHEDKIGIIDSEGGNETRPRNIYVMWIIKYTTAALGLTTDHGDLIGLGDDDHTQYSLVDGTRTFSGVVSGINPSESAPAALVTKEYVDDEANTRELTRVSVYLGSNQTGVETAIWTKCELDTKIFDTLTEFDIVTNNRFVTKSAGYYFCSGTVGHEGMGDADTVQCAIYVNGTRVSHTTLDIGGSASPGTTTSKLVYLDVDDYVELWGRHTLGSNGEYDAGSSETFLTIHRV